MPEIDFDTLTERDISKTIDHSLLRPELDDAFVEDGCRLAARYDVASVCVRPVDVVRARRLLDGTQVAVGTTVGFPHGNHLTEIKVLEARRALDDGATELDMVLDIGALKSGRDDDVLADIRSVVDVGHAAGAIVKVIFENAYLTDAEKIRACQLTTAAGGDFVKTSTGFAMSGPRLRGARRLDKDGGGSVKHTGIARRLATMAAVVALAAAACSSPGTSAGPTTAATSGGGATTSPTQAAKQYVIGFSNTGGT